MLKMIERALGALLKIVPVWKLIRILLGLAQKLALITVNLIDDIAVKLVYNGTKILETREGKDVRNLVAESLIATADAFGDYVKTTKTPADDIAVMLARQSGKIILECDSEEPNEIVALCLEAVANSFRGYVSTTATKNDDAILELVDATVLLLREKELQDLNF